MSTARSYINTFVRWFKRQCLIFYYTLMGVDPLKAIADHEQFQKDVAAAPDLFLNALHTETLAQKSTRDAIE